MNGYILIFVCFALFQDMVKSPDDFKWKNRMIIVRDFDEEIDLLILGNKKAIMDRKLIFVSFEKGELIGNSGNHQLDAKSFYQLFKRQKNATTWMLIGLDGGVKESGDEEAFNLEKLMHLIDQMPMRVSEMR